MKTKIASAALAFAALTTAQGAAAQQTCVEPSDLGDTITYAMPLLYQSIEAPCSSVFAASPFMVNDASAYVDQFRARQDAAWPGTLRLIKTLMAAETTQDGSSDATMAEAISQLPADTLRPFADIIINQVIDERIAASIKVDTCSDIAEAMELIAPLPPENLSGLAVFVAKQFELKNPTLCGFEPKPEEQETTQALPRSE
jgi:hypothetical protein